MYHTPKVRVTLGALVDAIIPNTPLLAFEQGAIQAVGGLYSHIDEYLIWSLDHFYFNLTLASPIAELLDIAASQLIAIGVAGEILDPVAFSNGNSFNALSQKDRLKAINLLPFPYQNNPVFIQIIADALDRFTVFGYYSEWSGYGVTRFTPFEERKLEDIPVSWKQVRYPGKAYRYHALRGYLLDKFTE